MSIFILNVINGILLRTTAHELLTYFALKIKINITDFSLTRF